MRRYLLGLCFLFALSAHAQTLPWNTDLLAWTAPTQCADGSPIAGNCDITGYKVETATSAGSATWTAVTTTSGTTLSYSVTNVAQGVHCYRVSAISTGGIGTPSSVACSTATPPAPGVPTLKTIDTLAYSITKGTDTLKLAQIGTVPLGTSCKPDQDANGLHVVPRAAVTVKGTTKPVVMVARCE